MQTLDKPRIDPPHLVAAAASDRTTRLGYVLPLIEHVDRSGSVERSFEASSFSEVVQSLWLPGSIRHGVIDPAHPGSPLRFGGFTWIKYELVNQQIPVEDFLIKLKAGVSVSDRRFGDEQSTFYVIDQNCTTADLIPTEPQLN